jgi:hypothetical protein
MVVRSYVTERGRSMPMRATHGVLAWVLLACAATVAVAQPGSKGMVVYRWVDAHGVVHYGDSVPPRYARDAREILNSEGVQVGHVAAAMSPAQRAAVRAARAREEARKQHDYFLLNTYASVKDIEALRDERLSQLESQQSAAQQYVQSLQARLASLRSRAMQFKPYSTQPGAPPMPEELAQELVQTLREVQLQNQALAQRTQQEAQVRSQFQADIERFEQLTDGSPP